MSGDCLFSGADGKTVCSSSISVRARLLGCTLSCSGEEGKEPEEELELDDEDPKAETGSSSVSVLISHACMSEVSRASTSSDYMPRLPVFMHERPHCSAESASF